MSQFIQFRGCPYQRPSWLPSVERCQEWQGRVVAIAGMATSLGLRIANLARWTNAAMPAVAGACTQDLIESFATPVSLPGVRKTSTTLFGFSLIYAADQLWENDIVSEGDTTVIVFTLGTNLYIFVKWLIQKRFLAPVEFTDEESERLAPVEETTEGYEAFGVPFLVVEVEKAEPTPVEGQQPPIKVQGMFPAQMTKYTVRTVACIALGTGAFLVKDEEARLFMGTLAEYYITENLGDWVMLRLIETVQKRDEAENHLSFLQKKGTYYRTLMRGLVTLAYIGIPFYLTPIFGDPHTLGRAYQLFYSAPLVGFFYGLMTTALQRRIENTPIQDLEELKEISNKGYLLWMKRFRGTASVLFCGFGIYQLATLSDTGERIGMLVSMLAFFGGFKVVASANNWSREDRIAQETFLQRYRQMRWGNTPWRDHWRAFKIDARDKFLFSSLLLQRVPLPNILDPLVPPPSLIANFMLNLKRANSGAVKAADIAGQVAIDATLFFDILAWMFELGRTSGKKMGVDGHLIYHGTIAGANTLVRVWRGVLK